MSKSAFLVLVLSTIVSGTAFAGSYADGYGETPDKAIASARDGAAKAVKSRGKGCVGGGNGAKELIYVGKETGLYHFKAHYHHHNGSCDKQKTIAEHLEDLGF